MWGPLRGEERREMYRRGKRKAEIMGRKKKGDG